MKTKTPTRTPALRRTSRGFAGRFGGRWGEVPQPAEWYSTSVQLCGLYPFGAGTSRPTDGAPLGRDMLVGTAVCTDHEALYRAGVISSPSMMLFGINGVGKSSTAQTILYGQNARGIALGLFDPMKGEHTAMARGLGCSVWEIGPGRNKDKINLLSSGPLGDAARKIGGEVGKELDQLARDKSVQLVQLITRISRRVQLEDIEDAVLEAMVDTVRERSAKPITHDLLDVFTSPSERVLAVAGKRDVAGFHQRFERLGETLRSMMAGEMGQLLGGDDSVEFDTGNPAGFCFDTSAISPANTDLLSAAMLSTWSLGMDGIDAHWELAQYENRKADEAAAAGELYVPRVVWGGYSTLMDEFWYPLRACKGIVDRVDTLSRTNRSKGTAEMKITHSPKDLLSLPDADDREKARGLTERAGLLGLMSLTREDLIDLSRVKKLTEKEIDLVAGFNAAQSWGGKTKKRFRVVNGQTKKPPPPGAGKILLKVEERVGIPVQMVQTNTQNTFHDTDTRYQD